jgi:spermidine/putrescine-binding protein
MGGMVPNRRIGRRRFLQGAAALGLAPLAGQLLTACGDPGKDRLAFWNWQDYLDEQLLEDFRREAGIVTSYSTYASNDELQERLTLAGVARKGGRKATTVDLVVPSDTLFRQLDDGDQLQDLDRDVVTDELLAALDPRLRDAAPGIASGRAVPWATGTTGIGYDTTVFDEPPGWEVFLDDAHAGKLTLLDERREAFAAALLSLGEDPNATDRATIDAAAEQLRSMLAVIDGFDSATYLDRLRSGELVAVQGFNTDVLQARADNPNLAFTIPEAGGTRWTDLLCIPTDAPNPEAANEFIAFYLRPDVSARNAEFNQVDTGNAEATAELPPALRDDPAIYPPADVADRLTVLQPLGDAEGRYADAWDEVRG